MGVDSQVNLFKQLPNNNLSKIERSVYNKRRRNLVNHLEEIRLKIASKFNKFKNYFYC